MRGIVLAGGAGTRLHPITRAISKQLVPVYDKPLVYYPLSTLMTAGVREVLVITTPPDQPQFRALLGDGSELGMRIEYAVQPSPDGLAQAFLIASDFVADEPVGMVLGDNIFHGPGLSRALREGQGSTGAHVFASHVSNPEAYGVVEFDTQGRVLSIQEKPERPASHWALVGMYFFDGDVVDIAAGVRPSRRGELEITSVIDAYRARDTLTVTPLPRGTAWFDTGTFQGLLDASQYVSVLESRQAQKIGCIEELAWRNGWIDDDDLVRVAEPLRKSGYGEYLLGLLGGEFDLS